MSNHLKEVVFWFYLEMISQSKFTENNSKFKDFVELLRFLVISLDVKEFTSFMTYRIQHSGAVFTKGLRLSQVLGLNLVLKLRLLSQLSFVLKPYSQRVT